MRRRDPPDVHVPGPARGEPDHPADAGDHARAIPIGVSGAERVGGDKPEPVAESIGQSVAVAVAQPEPIR
jgi:hypothetical protein